jgi:hypothetical protein
MKNYPMVVPQGATFTRTFDVSIDAVPWDFTGYSARMMVRESFDSTVPILSLTNFDGITIDDAGSITVTIPADVTEALEAGSYVYDLEVESAGGEVTRLLPTASFTVTPGVTRD